MPALRELSPTHDLPRTTRVRDHRCETPILDREGRLLGWTRQGPELSGTLLRHPYAERLVGGTVFGVYVQIDDPADAKRAGAPPDWKEPWRCLALCAEHAVTLHTRQREAAPAKPSCNQR